MTVERDERRSILFRFGIYVNIFKTCLLVGRCGAVDPFHLYDALCDCPIYPIATSITTGYMSKVSCYDRPTHTHKETKR